ncbi:MAG: hypothetical protein JWP07_478, partial [Pseudonocardiales bacterium]|nr:hypothetical protein [Pseudonocardiales bacterium]
MKVEGAAHDGFPLLDERVSTPTMELRGATDELLEQLAVPCAQARQTPILRRTTTR